MELRGEDGHSAGGVKGEKLIAEICRKHQISQALYYRWRDRFLEAGQKGLSNWGQ